MALRISDAISTLIDGRGQSTLCSWPLSTMRIYMPPGTLRLGTISGSLIGRLTSIVQVEWHQMGVGGSNTKPAGKDPLR